MDYLSFCPSLSVNKGFQLRKKMQVFFLLILWTGTNCDKFRKRCSVSRLFGKVENINLMLEGSNSIYYLSEKVVALIIRLRQRLKAIIHPFGYK